MAFVVGGFGGLQPSHAFNNTMVKGSSPRPTAAALQDRASLIRIASQVDLHEELPEFNLNSAPVVKTNDSALNVLPSRGAAKGSDSPPGTPSFRTFPAVTRNEWERVKQSYVTLTPSQEKPPIGPTNEQESEMSPQEFATICEGLKQRAEQRALVQQMALVQLRRMQILPPSPIASNSREFHRGVTPVKRDPSSDFGIG